MGPTLIVLMACLQPLGGAQDCREVRTGKTYATLSACLEGMSEAATAYDRSLTFNAASAPQGWRGLSHFRLQCDLIQ